jgi:hypothetical protein
MKKIIILYLFSQFGFAQTIPDNVKKLMRYYPEIIDFKENRLIFNDKSSLIYDDKKIKETKDLIENPDVEDQFFFEYKNDDSSPKNDAGRIRNEAFFKKIYGSSKNEVEKKLVEIIWCPKLVNQKIKVTNVNGIDKIVEKLSSELDKHPEFKDYISGIAGTFNWRKIAGTNRLSMHSFGMTIDINTKYSNYWQWDCKCKDEAVKLNYKNRIPKKIVAIFEKYGFIWGGNWNHYDTMHFEYRPELID